MSARHIFITAQSYSNRDMVSGSEHSINFGSSFSKAIMFLKGLPFVLKEVQISDVLRAHLARQANTSGTKCRKETSRLWTVLAPAIYPTNYRRRIWVGELFFGK